MKKTVLSLLTLCLILMAGVAMAAPALPDAVDMDAILPRPENAQFTYTIDGDELTIKLADQRSIKGIDISFNGRTERMEDKGNGSFTATFQPADIRDEDWVYIYINFDTPQGSESVAHSLGGNLVHAQASKKKENFIFSSHWDSSGDRMGFQQSYTNDKEELVDFVFDPQTGSLWGYSLVLGPNGFAQFDTSHQLQMAQLLVGDKSYGYDSTNGWFCFDDAWNPIPCDAPVSIAYLQDTIEDILSYARRKAVIENAVWHPKNSVCAAGLSVRDDLKISDLWYNVVPIDLTQEGTQELYLIAGNRHHIGKAYVTVLDGQATVTYRLRGGHGYIKSECVKWFTSLDQITEEFLKNPASDLAFGQAVNIEEELGGADVGILFIRNTATYRQPYTNGGYELSRYWRNRDRWIEWREGLNALLEK